jgi:hypothetical protein
LSYALSGLVIYAFKFRRVIRKSFSRIQEDDEGNGGQNGKKE